jgi:hypothetical protein
VRIMDLVWPWPPLPLAPEKERFFAELETMAKHPKPTRSSDIVIQCRCGHEYPCKMNEAFFTEWVKTKQHYPRVLERYRKYKCCPVCGYAEGRAVVS